MGDGLESAPGAGESLKYACFILVAMAVARDWAPGVEIEPYNCAFEWEERED